MRLGVQFLGQTGSMSPAASQYPNPLPVSELSAIVSSLETISARLDNVGDGVKGTDRGDQQSAELHLIASSIGQARRRLFRMIDKLS
jgi:hypothetical protein